MSSRLLPTRPPSCAERAIAFAAHLRCIFAFAPHARTAHVLPSLIRIRVAHAAAPHTSSLPSSATPAALPSPCRPASGLFRCLPLAYRAFIPALRCLPVPAILSHPQHRHSHTTHTHTLPTSHTHTHSPKLTPCWSVPIAAPHHHPCRRGFPACHATTHYPHLPDPTPTHSMPYMYTLPHPFGTVQHTHVPCPIAALPRPHYTHPHILQPGTFPHPTPHPPHIPPSTHPHFTVHTFAGPSCPRRMDGCCIPGWTVAATSSRVPCIPATHHSLPYTCLLVPGSPSSSIAIYTFHTHTTYHAIPCHCHYMQFCLAIHTQFFLL